MKTALVSGSSGFVGRHLIPELRKAGYTVTCVDHATGLSLEHWMDMKWEDPTRWDVICHLAANIRDIDARMKGKLFSYADISLDYRMAEYIEAHRPTKACVWMSSCAVDAPSDPYAWVKLCGEKFAEALYQAGVPISILRPFSGFGSDQALSYPFPSLLQKVLRRDDPVVVWGNTETVRDWLFVDDLVAAIMWAINDGPRGVPIDIGTGRATTFRELVTLMATTVGYKPQIVADETKATGSTRRVAETIFASACGFTALTSLEDAVRNCVAVHAKA